MMINGQIAYVCDDGEDEICVINADGTGFAQLTNNSTADDTPSLNDAGQIAYECNDGDEEICVINFDGTSFAQLTSNSSPDEVPSIN